MTKEELKEKCRSTLREYLASRGIDPSNVRAVIHELRGMWEALEKADLLTELKALGGSFQAFREVAIAAAQAKLRSDFAERLRKGASVIFGGDNDGA